MKKTSTSSLLKISATLVFGAFLFLAVIEFKYALSGTYFRSANKYTTIWQKQNSEIPITQWEQALSQAQRGLALSPNNPNNIHQVGTIYEWSDMINGATHSEKLANLTVAKTYYTKALELRPISPWGWQSLFRTMIKTGHTNQDTYNALSNALNYGPNDQEILVNLIIHGSKVNNMQISNRITEATSHLFKLPLLRRHHKQVYSAYKLTNKIDQLCELISAEAITFKLKNKCSAENQADASL